MESTYLAEEVIVHPNHPLTFGDWIFGVSSVKRTKGQLFRVVGGFSSSISMESLGSPAKSLPSHGYPKWWVGKVPLNGNYW